MLKLLHFICQKRPPSVQNVRLTCYFCINLLKPNVNYSGRTAPLTSKVAFYIFIQQIQVLNILNMVYTLRFFSSLQNAVCFIILTYLVPVLFTFYIQGVLKLKKNNSGAKRLSNKGVLPIPVAARFKTQVCGRSPAEIVGSNPARCMDVCCECCVLLGSGLSDGLIPR